MDEAEGNSCGAVAGVSAILSVRVYGSGRVGIRFGDRSESPTQEVRLDTAQRRMIELFRDWLAQGWAEPQKRKITRRRELEVLGMLLCARLFPGPLQGDLDEAVQAAGAGDPVRIELAFVDGAEPLASLPWEYLFRAGANGAGGYFLATDERIALSRYLPLDRAVQPLAPEQPPLRLLAAASKPVDEGPVREAETLAALAALPRPQVDVELLDHPTGARLREKLGSFQPHLVHLLAHGEYDAGAEETRIALEREDGTAHWVPDHLLVELFRQAGCTPHVVLLHACEGGAVGFSSAFAGLAPRLVAMGSEAVIAMQYPITNNAAGAFGTAFYAALADGCPIDAAVRMARCGMTVQRPNSYDTGEFGIPVLYLRSTESTAVVVR